jgi:outer membrane lipoprotein-sorting protein
MAGMGVVLLFTTAASAYAQPGGDAAVLVQEASSVALGAKSWRAEGTLVTRAPYGAGEPDVSFKVFYQLPRYARLETTGGGGSVVRVCEGAAQWTYYADLEGFVKVLLPQIGPCAFPLNAWPPLASTLQSPVLAGSDTLTVDGHPETCQIVRGNFTWEGRDPMVKETVTLCIDRAQKRILRYQLEHRGPGPVTTQTYTFSSLQIDPELDGGLFAFDPPDGSRALATIDWLTPIAGTPSGVYRVSDAVSAPILSSVVPPDRPAATAVAAGANTVALHAEIGRNGVPRAMVVFRSLGLGLDEQAIECVSQWRFQPAMSNIGPVAVAATIFVHFADAVAK